MIDEHELSAMRDYAQMIEYAETREDFGALYLVMVGYDCALDNPGASADELRKLCCDYIKEWSRENGVNCDDVFDPCVSDDDRSYGPWGRT